MCQTAAFSCLAKTRIPNCASRALALAVDALPAPWEQAHGYRPLVVENGGDALFQLKPNQPGDLQHAIDVAAERTPLLPANLMNNPPTDARNGGFTKSMR